MGRYPSAAAGLRLIFLSYLLTLAAPLVAPLTARVPLLDLLLSLAIMALLLAGLFRAGRDHGRYRGGLLFAALSFLLGLVSGFLSEDQLAGPAGVLLDMVSLLLGLLMVYAVCGATSGLLRGADCEELSRRGILVLRIYAVCTAVTIVCQLLRAAAPVYLFAGLANAIANLVQFVNTILLMLFLYQSSKAL